MHGSVHLHAVSALGRCLRISDESIRIAVGLWVGASVYPPAILVPFVGLR